TSGSTPTAAGPATCCGTLTGCRRCTTSPAPRTCRCSPSVSARPPSRTPPAPRGQRRSPTGSSRWCGGSRPGPTGSPPTSRRSYRPCHRRCGGRRCAATTGQGSTSPPRWHGYEKGARTRWRYRSTTIRGSTPPSRSRCTWCCAMPEQTVDDIRVLGSGMLASAITATLTTRSQPRDSGQAGGLVIVASDGWDTSDYPAARQLAQEYGSAWLPVRTELSHAVVGPLERPGQAGCVTCAELRRNRIRPDRAPHRAVWRQHRSRLAQRRSTWLTGLAADLVATLVADDVETLVNGQAPRTRGAII